MRRSCLGLEEAVARFRHARSLKSGRLLRLRKARERKLRPFRCRPSRFPYLTDYSEFLPPSQTHGAPYGSASQDVSTDAVAAQVQDGR